jgi:uncharacterized protein (TIGR00369 family)
MTDDSNAISSLQKRINSSPFLRWLGIKATSVDDSGLEMTMATSEDMIGSPTTQALHGGVMASLIDIACSFSIIVRNSEQLWVTIDLRTDYHRPCKMGVVRIVGEVVKQGRTLSTTEAKVYDQENRLIASGRAVMMAKGEMPTS